MQVQRYVLPAAGMLVIGLLLWSGLAQAEAVDFKKQMSAAEYMDAGLDKLTDEELAQLEAWLNRDDAPVTAAAQPAPQTASPAPAEPVDAEADFGKEQVRTQPKAQDNAPESITARLQGEFRGWEGKTIFRLDNGQVWQQRVGDRWRSPKRMDPVVTIERGRFGYYLSVEGSRRSIGVKRLK